MREKIKSFIVNKILQKEFNLWIRRLHPKEAVKFAREYFKKKPLIAVEIGVLEGHNSEQILKNLAIKKLYLIDPYVKYEEYKNDGAYSRILKAKKRAHKKLKEYSKKIVWIEDFSERAINKIKEGFDFIYIDGNHDYEYVKKDIELSWKKLKKGGILAGHDIDGLGVSKAVVEFIKKRDINPENIFFGNKTDWWIIKR